MKLLIGYIFLFTLVAVVVAFGVWAVFGETAKMRFDEIVSFTVVGLIFVGIVVALFRFAFWLISGG